MIGSASMMAMLKDMLVNDVFLGVIDGIPVDGSAGSGNGVYGPGSLLVDYTNKKLYQNTGTKASPTWASPALPESLILSQGTITTNQPNIDASVTWNAGGVTFTGWKLNVTDTASASASRLIDLQVGGVSKFKVDKGGAITATSGVEIAASTSLSWTSSSLIKAPVDGQLTLLDSAQTSFGRINFGGTTSSFPAIKRTTTTLECRLADDSAYAGFLAAAITSSAAILSNGATSGIGYATGAGGTVTQATSKTTGVTLNKATGEITMNAAALAGDTTAEFVLTNSAIALGDWVAVDHVSAGTVGAYFCNALSAAGSATIRVRNVTAASLSEAIVLKYTVIKAVTA